jgi:alkylhydroperoxidase family enzyme
MARIPLIDEHDHPELAPLIEKIRKERRGRFINVYRLLLNSPPLAETWFAHNNAVRWKTELDGRLRELVIVRIAYLTRVAYMLRQHVPKLAVAEGLTLEACLALEHWERAPESLFDARDRAVLAYTDAMARDIQVPDGVFAPLRTHFGNRAITDLTLLIGTYTMQARVFAALEIDPEADHAP